MVTQPTLRSIRPRDRRLANALLLVAHIVGERRRDRLFSSVRDGVSLRIAESLGRDGKGRSFPLERREPLSPDEFKRDYLKPGRPVVMEGAAADWPCVRKWSFDFFLDEYGDQANLLICPDGLGAQGEQSGERAASLRGIIEDIRAGRGSYLKFSALVDRCPELQEDLDLERLAACRNALALGATFQFFLGGDGSVTPLHNALMCNLFVQVEGEKQWYFYPASYTPVVRPAIARTTYNYSDVNIHEPAASHPGFEFADRWETRLKPGDVLFVPPYLWHQVENHGETIGVAYRFPDFRGALQASLTLTTMRLLATNPSFFETFYYSFLNRDHADRSDGFKTPRIHR